MVDFLNPANNQYSQSVAFAATAPSIQRQKQGTLTDDAVKKTDASNPSDKKPDEQFLDKALNRLKPKDSLKDLQERQRTQATAKSNESFSQETAEKTTQNRQQQTDYADARVKDRARVYNDDNKTLNSDEINLSKSSAETLNRENLSQKRASLSQAQQTDAATRIQNQRDSQSKQDLDPPKNYTQPQTKSEIILKSATQEKFESLHPNLVLTHKKNTDPRQADSFLKSRFESVQQQRQVALETRPATNTDTTARIDSAQKELATIKPLQADSQAVRENPQIVNNPTVSFSRKIKDNDTNTADRVDPGVKADIRKSDISEQQYAEAQKELMRNNTADEFTQQTRAKEVVGDTIIDNYDSYKIRQAERQTGTSEDPNATRLDRVNPRNAAVAHQKITDEAAEVIETQQPSQLEEIKKSTPEGDFGFPADVTPNAQFAKKQSDQLNGGDAINAPERQSYKKPTLTQDPTPSAVSANNIETSPESKGLEQLKTVVIKPDNTLESVIQPKDQNVENRVLSSRKDLTGIKARGEESQLITAEINTEIKQEQVDNKFHNEQKIQQELNSVAAEISVKNLNEREKADSRSIQNREIRTEDNKIDTARQKDKASELSTDEADAIADRYEIKVDQRTKLKTDFTSNTDAKIDNDRSVVETIATTKNAVEELNINRNKTDQAIAFAENVQNAAIDDKEEFIIEIVAPDNAQQLETAETSAIDASADSFNINSAANNAAGLNSSITVVSAEAALPGTAAAEGDARSPENQRETANQATQQQVAQNVNDDPIVIKQNVQNNIVANKDGNAASNLGDASARNVLDQVSGTG